MVYRRSEKVSKKLEAKLQAILQAAKEVFAEHGYHGTSIKDIARRAGVATGTIYLYLRNKEALFATLIDELYEMVLQEITAKRKEVTGTRAKLCASMVAALEVIERHRELAKVVLIQTPAAIPSVGQQLADLLERLMDLVQVDIEEALATGEIPPQDSRIAATAFVGTFYQTVASWLRKGYPHDLRQAADALIAYNLRGLGYPDAG